MTTRPGDADAPDARVESADDDELVVAECAPPVYEEGTEPHGGRLDDAEHGQAG